MKPSYDKKVTMRCPTCGDSHFEYNEDKTWIKCIRCGREFKNGADELIEFNQSIINTEQDETKLEVLKDLKKDLSNSIKKSLKGNKYLKFK
ncbi:MAG: hypothetical protein JXC36_00550 [Candidatus Atribacteria bacterium]|nr:hypothetical protein [Candidatus Atribacteria bacterium]